MAIRLEEFVPQNKGPHRMGAAKNEKKVVYSSAIPISSRLLEASERQKQPIHMHKHLDALLLTINSSSDQMMAVGPVITHTKVQYLPNRWELQRKRKRWFPPRLFPLAKAVPKASERQIQLISTAQAMQIAQQPAISSHHSPQYLNSMMMAVGPVITHKKSKVVRISCGPKVN